MIKLRSDTRISKFAIEYLRKFWKNVLACSFQPKEECCRKMWVKILWQCSFLLTKSLFLEISFTHKAYNILLRIYLHIIFVSMVTSYKINTHGVSYVPHLTPFSSHSLSATKWTTAGRFLDVLHLEYFWGNSHLISFSYRL